MIWLVWRQHRMQAMAALLGLLAVAAFLVPTGLAMHRAFDRDGVRACLASATREPLVELGSDSRPEAGQVTACKALADQFTARFGNLGTVAVLLWLLPLLAGLFWGAPLVARELEHGTHRLVWTQGTSRLRWALAKFGLVSGAVVLLAAGYALLVTWWRAPLDQAAGRGYVSPGPIYDLIGLVPIGYAVFAVALGVLAGVLTRRTQAAMGVTLVGFLATRVLMDLMLRPHLLTPERRVLPTASSKAPNQLVGDWILRSGIYGADGRRLSGGTLGSFSQQYCGAPATDPKVAACLSEHGPGAYNLELFYSGHRIWLLQGIETALLVVLAAVLLLASAYWIRRRRVA